MEFNIIDAPEKIEEVITNNLIPCSGLVIKLIKEKFNPLIEEIKANTKGYVINNNDSKLKAADFLGNVKKLSKKIKDHSVEVTKTQKEFVKEIDNFVKPYITSLGEISTELSNKLATYSYQEEISRREEEKKIRLAQEKAMMEINKQALENNIDISNIAITAPVVKQETTTKVSSGTFFIKKQWTYEIIDLKKVPAEYTEVIENKKAIKSAIDAGVREIEGIKIFEKAIGNFRG